MKNRTLLSLILALALLAGCAPTAEEVPPLSLIHISEPTRL